MTEFMLRDLAGKRVDVVSPVAIDPEDFAGIEWAVELIVNDESLILTDEQARALGMALIVAAVAS